MNLMGLKELFGMRIAGLGAALINLFLE